MSALRFSRHCEELESEMMDRVSKEIEAKYRDDLVPLKLQMRRLERRKRYQQRCACCGGMGCACPDPWELKEYRALRKRMDTIYERGI